MNKPDFNKMMSAADTIRAEIQNADIEYLIRLSEAAQMSTEIFTETLIDGIRVLIAADEDMVRGEHDD